MSFTNAPITKTLVISLIGISILASLLDIKHKFFILTDPHLWQYGQYWRILAFQLCYANATEVLFASMTLYSLRAVERLWGSRKFASFLVISYVLTSFIVVSIQVFLVAPLSLRYLTYIPSGPTPLIFSILAQYHAMIPHLYQYRLVLPSRHQQDNNNNNNNAAAAAATTTVTPSSSSSTATATATSATVTHSGPSFSLTFSDKTTKYIPPLHLILSSLPISPLLALIGWTIGYLHRTELLPPRLTHWRIPLWLTSPSSFPTSSSSSSNSRERFEGLQRRLEDEGTTSGIQRETATGGEGAGNAGEQTRRRNMGQQILDQLRGTF